MKIYKFGGASVKDAEGVKNLVTILNYLGHHQTLIVVSAMGKTTNSLELVVKNYFDNKEIYNTPLMRFLIFTTKYYTIYLKRIIIKYFLRLMRFSKI